MFLNRFVDSLILKDHHREELRLRRGIPDRLIDKLKFKSCGFYLVDHIHKHKFDESLLQQHQIKQPNGFINKQLLEDRILIPYIDADGSISKIRPHKLGFRGQGSDIYCPSLLQPGSHDIIITEGEFKAAAGHAIGLNVVAIPGIMSFIKTRFQDLEEFLDRYALMNVTILFDREIKDNPAFKNYKPNWRKRHDTEIAACVMAQKLGGVIAEFPLEWMVDGKVDIDQAVASGKTLDDFNKSVLSKSMAPDEYIDELKFRYQTNKREAWHVIKRCARLTREPMVKKGDCYEILKKQKSGGEDWVKVSNCVINIESKYFDTSSKSMKRLCRLSNENDEQSATFDLEPEMMTSRAKFRLACANLGEFMFFGSDADLDKIFEYEALYSDVESTIVMIDHCGHVQHESLKKHDIWVFENVAFVDDTKVFPDDSGVFWLDSDKMLGFKIINSAHASNETPTIDLGSEFNAKDFHDRFIDVAGNNGRILLGWAVHCLVVDYLGFEEAYPWAFLYGKSGEGKTTICNILMRLFGFSNMGVGLQGETDATLRRVAAYYASLPVWFDEYHNSKKIQSFEPLFKSFFNHKPMKRADRNDLMKTTSFHIRANILLSGETTPSLDGVRNRGPLLHTHFDKTKNKKDQINYLNKKNWSSFVAFILSQRTFLAKRVAEIIRDVDAVFSIETTQMHHRMIDAVARFVGCYEAIWGRDDKFWKWLVEVFLIESNESLKNDQMEKFFEHATLLVNRGLIDESYAKFVDFSKCKHALAINLSQVFNLVSDTFKNSELASAITIKDVLSKDPGFITKRHQVRFKGSRIKCFMFDPAKTEINALREFAETLFSKTNRIDPPDFGGDHDDLFESNRSAADDF